MRPLQTDGSGEVDQQLGRFVCQTLLLLTFFFGFMSRKVYYNPVRDVSTLIVSIMDAIKFVTPNVLQYTWRKIKYRRDVLRAKNGAHVEND